MVFYVGYDEGETRLGRCGEFDVSTAVVREMVVLGRVGSALADVDRDEDAWTMAVSDGTRLPWP